MQRKKLRGWKFVATVVSLLLAVLAYALVATYGAYTATILTQQQQHLLIISRSMAKNLDLYVTEQLRDIEILTGTPGFESEFNSYYRSGKTNGLKEYILDYMLSQHQGLSRVYLLDRNSKVIFKYNQYPFLETFDEKILHLDQLVEKGQSGIGSAFPISAHHYGMTLVNSIYQGDTYVGTVVGIVDLQTLYEQLGSPLNMQSEGHLLVMDQQGTVIMHPDEDMMGFNFWNDIPGLYSNPQYASLLNMLNQQDSSEEGVATYHSIPQKGSPPIESVKITAFSRVNIGNTSWIVSTEMPYKEAMEPVNQSLTQFGLLVTVILLILIIGLTVIYRLQKKQQKLKMEAHYLKDLNNTFKELSESREQIRHYQKLQTIGTLAGGIAHEFNNLLTPILGYSEFLKEQLGPESEYYEDTDEIYKAGMRAKEIVEQILPFSRRESNTVAYAPFSLDAVLCDALKMVHMILPSSIQLKEEIPKTGVNIYGSATQLNQVLLNLCSNSYQAMEEDGGTLTVTDRVITQKQLPLSCKRDPDIEQYAEITVEDTGCGMSEEVIQRIFDPFFTTKDVGKGTGLGLSVVQNIITSHNGFIEVKSTVGTGSCFTIYLPVTEMVIEKEERPTPTVYKQSGQISLMVVDDENRVTQFLKKRFVKKGFLVDAQTDSEKALLRFKENPYQYDLLIVDYTMPKCKGTVFAEHVKKIRGDIPVILITGLVEKDVLQKNQEKIIDSIILKPLDFNDLLQQIHGLLA